MSNIVINPYNFLVADVGAWKYLGRTTLGGTSDNITVSSLPDKMYYMCLANTLASGNSQSQIQMGNGSVDTSSIYAGRFENNGAADGTTVNDSDISISDTNSTQAFEMGYISNLSAQEKLWQGNNVLQNTAGSGTSPNRTVSVGKYAYTSNPIDVINWFNRQTGSFNTGSELVILGYDPTDTHTTADNFWEELASVNADGLSNTLSASITSKKYLWVQCYEESSAGSVSFRVGNTTLDGANNYAARVSSNGGAEDATTGIDAFMGLTSTTPIFWNFFIINNSANEKLAIGSVSRQKTAGAGNAPQRVEGVYKWANTSNQIDILGFIAVDGGATVLSNSILKVWGHD